MTADQGAGGAAAEMLRKYFEGQATADQTFFSLLLGAETADAFQRLLGALDLLGGSDADRAEALRALARRYPQAWTAVRSAAAALNHDELPHLSAEERVRTFARSFDAAAQASPEAGVALYSFGDPERLELATAEVTAWLRIRGAVGASARVLDIGCGIGRFEAALHASVGAIVGIDISAAMISVAKSRCGHLPNVEFRVTSGLDLKEFPPTQFDCVLAADVFPYLELAGRDLAERHLAECARVLRKGGQLAILNYSYSGTPDEQGAQVSRAAQAHGLHPAELGIRPFQLWDGCVFRLLKG